MLSCGHLTLFLLFVFTVFFIGSPTKFANGVQITFISGLPNNTEALALRCSNGEHFVLLEAGDEDQWNVKDDVTRTCDAYWKLVFRNFDVYQPDGDDAGKSSVYWLVKEDGFYRSWDKSNWNQTYYWDHE